MSLGARRLLPLFLGLAPLLAGPPSPQFAAQQAMQAHMQMQMQWQMQWQMQRSAARQAALQARRRQASEQAARMKNAPQTEEILKPAGEAWRIPVPTATIRAEDADVVVITHEKWLIARSRDKGADLWSAAIEGGLEGGPVVANGLVLYGTSDYRFVALEKATGKPRYRVQLEALRTFVLDNNNKTKVQFPIVEGQRVYLATFGKGTDGEAAGKLYALDLDSGAKLWEVPLAAGADHPPVILGDRILVGGAPWIQAFQVADGKALWKTNLGAGRWISPGVEAQGRYCLTLDETVVSLDPANGEVAWRAKAGSGLVGEDARLFSLRQGTFGGTTLVALDASTGRIAWERKGVVHMPWIQEGRVFLAEDGAVRCLDAADGKQVWESPMAKPAPWPPMVFGTQLIVACPEGKTTILRALDPGTGKEAWSATTQAKPGFGLFSADRAGILFPGKDDLLICLK